ncbi:MAG: hypothetical protein ACREFX_07435 [Opitutaceae bacterium]
MSAPAPSAVAVAQWQAGFVGAFRAIALVLSMRLVLLLAAAGAFALGWEALRLQTTGALIAAGCYYLAVFVPIVGTEARRR